MTLTGGDLEGPVVAGLRSENQKLNREIQSLVNEVFLAPIKLDILTPDILRPDAL